MAGLVNSGESQYCGHLWDC